MLASVSSHTLASHKPLGEDTPIEERIAAVQEVIASMTWDEVRRAVPEMSKRFSFRLNADPRKFSPAAEFIPSLSGSSVSGPKFTALHDFYRRHGDKVRAVRTASSWKALTRALPALPQTAREKFAEYTRLRSYRRRMIRKIDSLLAIDEPTDDQDDLMDELDLDISQTYDRMNHLEREIAFSAVVRERAA